MVQVEAEPGVAGAAVQVRVRVLGGQEDLVERVDQTLGTALEPVRFPVTVAVIPQDRDATRRFRVEATALDAAGDELGTVRALTGFVPHRTSLLRLLLEDCCRPVVCGAEQTCRGCECVTAQIDPTTLPPLGDGGAADAGAPRDAATSPVDASTPRDAFIPRDAGPPPIVGQGQPCDLADIANHCVTGTVCTCTGAGGCRASAEAPACWAARDINCGRPIDLSARLAAAGGGAITFTFDASAAPDVTGNTCGGGGPVGDMVHIVHVEADDVSLVIDASSSMEPWYGCSPGMPYGSCTGRWIFPAYPAMDQFILVEASGPYTLTIRPSMR